jgi:hypothetical protein
MHFNADHSRLYVACSDDDAVDIVDVAKRRLSADVNLPATDRRIEV